MPKRHLINELDAGLAEWLDARNVPAYRAGQIRRWIFQSRCDSFAAMSDLPLSLREELEAEFSFWSTGIDAHHQARDGTEKLLLGLRDGGQIECVLLRDGHRRSICVSTQVGCAMGCVFCASGLEGVARNLTTGEIIEQFLRLQRLLPKDERLSHIVVMGMGEPLANISHLLQALRWARGSDGLGISSRRITISTVGLPDGIDRLAQEDHGYELAVSLHAPDDALRNKLVRVNQKIGIDSILAAADNYFRKSGRRLTFEYVLLREVNDRHEHAIALAQRLAHHNALVNLIPFNHVEGLPYQRPSDDAVRTFRDTLVTHGIQVQIRKKKGDDINAACGQLRRQGKISPAVHDFELP